MFRTSWPRLHAELLRRNGKIDKRALKAVALEPPSPVPDSPLTDGKAPRTPSTITEVDAGFYAKGLYSSDTPKSDLSMPDIPPPVYGSEASISEKKLAYDQVPVLEKQSYPWDGYLDDEVPDKTQGKLMRNVRHQVFSLYRRLFGIVFVANAAVLIATFARPGGTDAQHLGLIVVSNLFCAILMRQDYVINTFFTVACAVPIS